MLRVLEPFTGSNLQGFKVYGTNAQEWQRALLQDYDLQELPLEFGGTNRKLVDLAS